jgi:hypothetical protein
MPGASAALFGLLGWFYVELGTEGLQVGLAERVARATMRVAWGCACRVRGVGVELGRPG